MSPIVAMYVDEIVNAAVNSAEGRQPSARAIADAVDKAYIHFRSTAGADEDKLRALLRELAEALRRTAQSATHSADADALILEGAACADSYLKSAS